ncbi:Piso0_002271 [Millerozyma farinosa CBS 7064]|uniref:Piso0_002271 protein n=1 Tax=Pichia sorbitophila (strain ATCC MYA-4447 / BCRC 22081 / CBS 7064 / NBRC 10061 / NRRL Y-12695) TaxID=559304 RepID=G8YC60_PICSO|nr:Piso0_002271 [Millerozyma farinosa CBS 7064]
MAIVPMFVARTKNSQPSESYKDITWEETTANNESMFETIGGMSELDTSTIDRDYEKPMAIVADDISVAAKTSEGYEVPPTAHMEQWNVLEDIQWDLNECPKCFQGFADPRSYRMHIDLHILDLEEDIICESHCVEDETNSSESDIEYSSLYKDILELASRPLHYEHVHITRGDAFQCDICSTIFTSPYRLNLHMLSHKKKSNWIKSEEITL